MKNKQKIYGLKLSQAEVDSIFFVVKPPETYYQLLLPEDRILSAAAAINGKKGGNTLSELRAQKARENGKKGGRPKINRDNPRDILT